MRYRIQTPVHGFTGTAAGIVFVDGQAVIDGDQNVAALAYFRRQHYGITPDTAIADPGPELARADAPQPAEPDVPEKPDEPESPGPTPGASESGDAATPAAAKKPTTRSRKKATQ